MNKVVMCYNSYLRILKPFQLVNKRFMGFVELNDFAVLMYFMETWGKDL
jgi:hypothetical protein